jgi:hypothetical protein
MYKPIDLQSAQKEYFVARKCLLAAQIASRAHPGDSIDDAEYRLRLWDLNAKAAALVRLEASAVGRTAIPAIDPFLSIALALHDDHCHCLTGVPSGTSPANGTVDGKRNSRLSTAIVGALDEAKAMLDAEHPGTALNDVVTYARDLHAILLTQMHAARDPLCPS